MKNLSNILKVHIYSHKLPRTRFEQMKEGIKKNKQFIDYSIMSKELDEKISKLENEGYDDNLYKETCNLNADFAKSGSDKFWEYSNRIMSVLLRRVSNNNYSA